MTFRKYLITLLITALVCSTLSSLLPAVSHSHVLAGSTHEEKWTGKFTVNLPDNQYLLISENIKAELERSISVKGSGPLRVTSANLEVTPLEKVSWSVGKSKTLTAPGAQLDAVIQWEAALEAGEGAKGQISIRFPSSDITFRSGSYQREEEDWFIREVAVHQSAFGLALGKWKTGWIFGVPAALALQSIWLLIVAVKKNRAAAAQSAANPALPRVFASKPLWEWQTWAIMMLIFGLSTSFVLFLAAGSGFLSPIVITISWSILGAGLLFGLIMVWLARRFIVTVRVDAEKLAIARGRGEPQWQEAEWKDIQSLRTLQRKREQWIEVVFPGGKKHKIYASTLLDYPALQAAMSAAYEQRDAKG